MPLIENITHHVRSSSDFIQTISSLMVCTEDIMVSFDVKATMNQFDQQISVDITSLIHLMLM
jgi:hypothetical protein